MNTARVALIGANGHGLSHRRAISTMSTVALVGIADVAPVQDPPPGVPVYASHLDLLAEVEPDIAVVCTPPHTHLPIAIDALRAGTDVLLEKPPVLDAAEHQCLLDVLAVDVHGIPPVVAAHIPVGIVKDGEQPSLQVRTPPKLRRGPFGV